MPSVQKHPAVESVKHSAGTNTPTDTTLHLHTWVVITAQLIAAQHNSGRCR